MNHNDRARVIAQVQYAYDGIAGHFSQTRQHQWEEVEYLIEHTVQPHQTLLDIGCGNGRVAQIAKKIKANYIGIDLSSEMITLARQHAPWGEFFVSDMQHLPLADQAVSHIIGVASFHHLPDTISRLQALQEMNRVLQSGGNIMLLNWNLFQPRFWKLRLRSLAMRLFYGKKELGLYDVLVPWRDAKRNIQAERYYHAFSKREIRRLVAMVPGLAIVDQHYEKNGMHVSQRHGYNLVTIIEKRGS